MTNKKSMKRALISSLLIMAMCFTMLAGTTYAWFTDSVTSANNIIKSGKLDVSLKYADGTEALDDAEWKDASAGAIFNYDLWEPGYVDVKHIAIANEGNLALKYQVKIIANGEFSDLADVIDVYYFDPAKQIASREALVGETSMGTLTAALSGMATTASGRLAPEEDDVITIALKMQESAGNAYQDKSIGTSFSIVLLATQDTVEEDSFDEFYDAAATYPVADAAEFTAALSDPTVGSIVLNNNIAVPGVNTIDGQVLDGNGNTITVSNTGSDCGLNAKSGTIKNVNIVGAGRGIGTGSSGSYAMDGDLYIDGVTVNGPTYGINIGAGNGKKVVVTDSEIYGWNSMANVDASFTNCKFGKGNTNYAVFAIYTYAISFTNCEFGAGYAFYGRASSGGTITLNNCTVGDTTVTAANFATLFDTPHDSDFDYLMNKCEIYVDGVKVN